MRIDDAQDLQDQPEEQPYSSFLIRCWGLSDWRQRIKVQHALHVRHQGQIDLGRLAKLQLGSRLRSGS